MKLLKVTNSSNQLLATFVTDQVSSHQEMYTLWEVKYFSPYTDKLLHDEFGDLAIVKPNRLTLLKTKVASLGYKLYSTPLNGSPQSTILV